MAKLSARASKTHGGSGLYVCSGIRFANLRRGTNGNEPLVPSFRMGTLRHLVHPMKTQKAGT